MPNIISCAQKRYQIQNDLNDWIVDKNNNPIEPIDAFMFNKLNKKIPKPQDIPNQKVSTRIDLIAIAEDK